ncbi:protein EARLY RESPONSIVE TO DEHYDRATION 15 [Sorghum bicolor]|jgi:hypothetical protein|uniref:Ataxin-2 C-terminal domain-containing protein n=1 Tax=Sorghum bicolor TaxID=4558 RepID=C5X4S5_SORBI|nr:protein EARLY RESPONSIVE TO DEHYDRATION 15 [Sorghum bicolor]EER99855.1 hypothetical protein SORBI_3002G405600 [Sorghum bicolor]|eukprot:XP_002463334.1 protein EARLY RESPONSIVE TO DEHYDRATION 15 [Sorghum bicolor]
MSTVAAMASSSLNPNAPLFIPAAYRQVEDFSPEWWELVKTTAWFRDHWFRQHQLHEAAYDAAFAADAADDFDVAALLPDDSVDLLDMVDTDDLFYAPDVHHHQAAKPAPAPGYDLDVLRALSVSSPRAAATVVAAPSPQQQRYADKPAYHAGGRGAARRAIHQPR